MIMMKPKELRDISTVAMLAALACIMQLLPFWPTTWGMRIDLVAVPWFLALFLVNLRGSLVTALITFLFIGFFAPSSWLGASLKLVATLPILLGFYFAFRKRPDWKKGWVFVVSTVAVRVIVMLILNYYVALPIWLSMETAEIISKYPWWMIAIPNIVQSAIEISVAYYLLFFTRLRNRIK